MEFHIGQIFAGDYPESVTEWCKKNNATIVEKEALDGVRQFEIAIIPPPPETRIVRTFAKDAIWVATKDVVADETTGETVWEKFKGFLLDSGLWEGWSMQAYLLEENQFFKEFYPRAAEVFGAEVVDNVLSSAVVESRTVIVGQ